MFKFSNPFTHLGIKLGQGEQIVGTGIEAAGTAIRQHGLRMEMRCRAELMIDGNRHTKESLETLYKTNSREAAINVLCEQLIAAKMSGAEKFEFLTEAANQQMRQVFAAAIDPLT